MNIIRFNDPFDAALKTWPTQNNLNASRPPFRADWKTAPLFEYSSTREKEKAFVEEMVREGIRPESAPWPFETFRLALTQTSETGWREPDGTWFDGKGRFRVDFIVTRSRERIFFLGNAISLYDETPDSTAFARKYAPLILYLGDAHTTVENPDSYRFHGAVFAGGRWIESDAPKDLMMGMMDAIAGFLMDAMVPSNHLVEVRPDGPGRSVEWTKARTHYTLITHGHPANRKGLAEGARVESDAEGELTRMAHNRRAHYKTLRHQRYRFARGKRIFVRACWVGPKEWKDEGGRQIYRILEPVNEQEQAA